jgi:hypothetical protein
MPLHEPTAEELAQVEREIMRRRGKRVLAAEAAAKAKGEAAKNRTAADPTAPRATFVMGPKRLTLQVAPLLPLPR